MKGKYGWRFAITTPRKRLSSNSLQELLVICCDLMAKYMLAGYEKVGSGDVGERERSQIRRTNRCLRSFKCRKKREEYANPRRRMSATESQFVE